MQRYSIFTASEEAEFCTIGSKPEALEKTGWRITKGKPMQDKYPDDVLLEMDRDFAGKVVPDMISNTLHYCLISERLKQLFEQEANASIEFLPFSILNHKGRAVEGTFYIANVLDEEDCIDLEKSDYDESKLKPGMLSRIFEVYLDQERIRPEAKLFRLRQIPFVLIIRGDLRAALEEAAMTGIRYIEMGEECFIN